MFQNLFSPIKVNSLEIKNRIAYPSLGLLYCYDRKINDRYFNFYKEVAKGGAGIVTVGPVGVDYLGSGIATLAITDDEDIPSWARLAQAIKDEGASPWIQLFHAGAYSYPMIINNEQPLAPSAVYSKYSKTTPKEMTIEDIKTVQTAYAEAARRAKEAGFEGVEILASAGYLMTQFLSPVKNQRTDEYGGSLENRLRFPLETIAGAREKLGPDFPLTVRMAGNDFVPGSNTDTETPLIAKAYEKAGIDMINVTGGWHESRVPQLPMELPRGCYSYLAMNIKKEVSIPVMASNRITTPFEAEKILQNGAADMVNLGRILLADPEWPKKAQAGVPEEIRPCVGCSQGCTDSVFGGMPVFCIANPKCGFEEERKLVPTDSPKNIMVVGAGVSGLEAALTAKLIGHNVEIYDKKDTIGGQLWIAGNPPHKEELHEFGRYYKAMLKKYDIPLHLNTEVDIEMVREKNPDHVIACEGAKPLTPPIEGLDSENVLSSWEVLEKNPLLGKEVAVIGAGAVGLETALFISKKGTINPEMLYFLMSFDAQSPERLKELMFDGTSNVTVFELTPKPGTGIGKSTKWVVMSNIEKHKINIITEATVTSFKDGTITFEKDGSQHTQQFDNVVIAAGSKSVTTLSDALKDAGVPYTSVGDCVRPGQLNDAIHGGYLAALNI